MFCALLINVLISAKCINVILRPKHYPNARSPLGNAEVIRLWPKCYIDKCTDPKMDAKPAQTHKLVTQRPIAHHEYHHHHHHPITVTRRIRRTTHFRSAELQRGQIVMCDGHKLWWIPFSLKPLSWCTNTNNGKTWISISSTQWYGWRVKKYSIQILLWCETLYMNRHSAPECSNSTR